MLTLVTVSLQAQCVSPVPPLQCTRRTANVTVATTCTDECLFHFTTVGEGRWEIYFYGNSGSDYVSLYLSAEPTAEERERGIKLAARNRSYTASMLARSASNPALAAAVAASKHQLSNIGASSSSQQHQHQSSSSNGGHNGTSPPHPHSSPWVREGSFRFAFEIRSTNKKESPIKMMEAADHVFSSEARNWGWQSFAKRSDVYYNNMAVRHADAFVIACTITHTPARPAPPPNPLSQKRLMPVELLTAYAALFDDPAYSDVKFIIRCGRSHMKCSVDAVCTDGC